MLKQKQKYGLLQSLGWGIFALLNLYISFLAEVFTLHLILINILLACSGWWITHLFRKYAIKHGWHELQTQELIFRILIVTVLMAFALCIAQYILIQIFDYNHARFKSLRLLFKPFVAAYIIMLIWQAIYFSWSFFERNRQQLLLKLQMENELKDLELKSLRANLQPHFIFNALNSIRSLVSSQPDTARMAITQLSNILRNTISSTEELISLEKELQFVKDYLQLEKLRFEHRLRYKINIPENFFSIMLPPLSIQTLVENAIKHGISKNEEGGEICIYGEEKINQFEINIENDGQWNREKNGESLGFGLNGAIKRLHHLYPIKENLIIEEKNNKVNIKMIIPK